MEIFVLGEPRGWVPGLVDQLGEFLQGGHETEFLPKPAPGGIQGGLARTGVTATGI